MKALNTANDICRKCRQNLETMQCISAVRLAQAQGDDTHRHSQITNIVHKELATNCGQSNRPSTLYHKYEPHIMMENSNCRLYRLWSIATNRTVHNIRPDVVVLDKTNKQTNTLNRRGKSQQSQLSQHHHREATEVYRLETGL